MSKDKYLCPLTGIIKNKKKRMKTFLTFLKGRYAQPECALEYKNAYELLCATILSAQCTDRQVNKVTPELFKKYPTVEALAVANREEVEELIRSTGFYKNKAKNLIGMASDVVLNHNSEIPSDINELVKLPGVGRKTANVVLGNVFNIPGIVVDTHVGRIANRLAFVDTDDPVKIEFELEKQLPKSDWVDFSHQVILLGRELCTARKPHCDKCPLSEEVSQKL